MPDLTENTVNTCDDPSTAIIELCTSIRRPPSGGPGGLSGPGFLDPDLLAAKLEKALYALHNEIQQLKLQRDEQAVKIQELTKRLHGGPKAGP